MQNICLYFQIHHPYHFRTFRFFDIGEPVSYYDNLQTERELQEAAENYYIPANNYLRKLLLNFQGKLKISFNISDTAFNQFLIYSPRVISGLQQLAETECVEFTGNTTAHSIVSLAGDDDELIENIRQRRERIQYYFGHKPELFVNTDLLFSNRIAHLAAQAGYDAILTNGAENILQWRSPNYLYTSEVQEEIKVLFRNEYLSNQLYAALNATEKVAVGRLMQDLSDSIGFLNPEEPAINIYLNYQALGGPDILLKQRIFSRFVAQVVKKKDICFCLPSALINQYGAVSTIGTEIPVCWKEHFHPAYYPGNELQKDAIRQLFKLSKKIEKTTDDNLKTDWLYLQTSDHFHYMDENHPDYTRISAMHAAKFKSKYDAYINYMNILSDFKHRLDKNTKASSDKKAWNKPFSAQKNAELKKLGE